MTVWKVVPVEPNTAILDVLHDNWIDEYGELLVDVYQAILAAAPTPPVVLPPLPKGINDRIKEFANACAFGGRDERVEADMALTREIRSYARAALAQYGIVDRQEDAA